MAATGFALRQRFDDMDAFIAAMNRSGGSIVPMARGPWQATLSMAELGALTLYHAEVPPQIRDGAIAQGEMVMVSRAPPGAVLHLGHEFEPDDVSVIGAGTVLESRYHQPIAWSGVQFAPGALAALAEDWGARLPPAGGHGVLRAGDANRRRIMAAVEGCLAEALATPDLLACPAAAEDAILQVVARAFADHASWVAQPRATAVRRRIVRDVTDLLDASPARSWSISAITATLGVAPRTLHGAFAAVYGCSPYAFLKRRRLALVRRALLTGGAAVLVKTIALDHGFWHLGHFAIDYRALFGETPQETRRRAPHRQVGWRAAADASA